MSNMRLDKYITHTLKVTRQEAKALIQRGVITVNNQAIRKAGEIIQEETDTIMYQQNKLIYKEFVYYMMHKPRGVISATQDKKDQTVIDLLQDADKRKNLSIVGRLDKDTEGLLLITNNGQLAHALTSPKKEVWKKYYVEVEGELGKVDVDMFSQGVEIILSEEETYLTKKAKLEILTVSSNSKAYVYISEGKFHQIKKMFLSLGKKVVYLKRLSIGDLALDPKLRLGEYRELTSSEIELVKNNAVK